MFDLPDNVFYLHGKFPSTAYYRVQCLKCFGCRTIRRKDNAIRSSKTCCRSCSNKIISKPVNYRGINIMMVMKYRLNAEARGRVWNITLEQLADLAEAQEYRCAFSGRLLIFDMTRNNNTASLDRLDNSKGYTIDNVQWVHKDLNMLRGSIQVDKFIDLCRQVASHRKKKRGS